MQKSMGTNDEETQQNETEAKGKEMVNFCPKYKYFDEQTLIKLRTFDARPTVVMAKSLK